MRGLWAEAGASHNCGVRRAVKGVRSKLFETLTQAGESPAQVLITSAFLKAHHCASEVAEAEAEPGHRSRGGRTIKIHPLTNCFCRLPAFLLTGGQVTGCKAGAGLLKGLRSCRILPIEKGSDSDATRR